MQRRLFLMLRCQQRQINKHFHIWSGHAAFIAGAIQCYRGVELVSSQDSLVFSTFEIDYQVRVLENKDLSGSISALRLVASGATAELEKRLVS